MLIKYVLGDVIMDFLQLAKKRYSVRKYEERKVEDEKLEKILEAGRVAPTGANRQPQRFIIVRSEEGLSKVNKTANTYGAPLAIIICSDHDATWKRRYDDKDIADIDASIVTDHMMLQAADLGLGSVWICSFDPQVIRKDFNIPENIEAVNILVIGYALGEAASPDRHNQIRKPLSELIIGEE
jgi:nitroreductase